MDSVQHAFAATFAEEQVPEWKDAYVAFTELALLLDGLGSALHDAAASAGGVEPASLLERVGAALEAGLHFGSSTPGFERRAPQRPSRASGVLSAAWGGGERGVGAPEGPPGRGRGSQSGSGRYVPFHRRDAASTAHWVAPGSTLEEGGGCEGDGGGGGGSAAAAAADAFVAPAATVGHGRAGGSGSGSGRHFPFHRRDALSAARWFAPGSTLEEGGGDEGGDGEGAPAAPAADHNGTQPPRLAAASHGEPPLPERADGDGGGGGGGEGGGGGAARAPPSPPRAPGRLSALARATHRRLHAQGHHPWAHTDSARFRAVHTALGSDAARRPGDELLTVAWAAPAEDGAREAAAASGGGGPHDGSDHRPPRPAYLPPSPSSVAALLDRRRPAGCLTAAATAGPGDGGLPCADLEAAFFFRLDQGVASAVAFFRDREQDLTARLAAIVAALARHAASAPQPPPQPQPPQPQPEPAAAPKAAPGPPPPPPPSSFARRASASAAAAAAAAAAARRADGRTLRAALVHWYRAAASLRSFCALNAEAASRLLAEHDAVAGWAAAPLYAPFLASCLGAGATDRLDAGQRAVERQYVDLDLDVPPAPPPQQPQASPAGRRLSLASLTHRLAAAPRPPAPLDEAALGRRRAARRGALGALRPPPRPAPSALATLLAGLCAGAALATGPALWDRHRALGPAGRAALVPLLRGPLLLCLHLAGHAAVLARSASQRVSAAFILSAAPGAAGWWGDAAGDGDGDGYCGGGDAVAGAAVRPEEVLLLAALFALAWVAAWAAALAAAAAAATGGGPPPLAPAACAAPPLLLVSLLFASLCPVPRRVAALLPGGAVWPPAGARAAARGAALRMLFAPFPAVILVDFFLADQAVSQATAWTDMAFGVAWYGCGSGGGGGGGGDSWAGLSPGCRRLLSPRLVGGAAALAPLPRAAVALAPLWLRLMQCGRRLRDEQAGVHALNMGKYGLAALATALAVAAAARPGAPGLAGARTAALCASSAAGLYWDVGASGDALGTVMDWGLLVAAPRAAVAAGGGGGGGGDDDGGAAPPHPPGPLARLAARARRLRLRPGCGPLLGLNAALRLAWVAPLVAAGRPAAAATPAWLAPTLAAAAEVLRRCLWSTHRLAHEHAANVRARRRAHAVPLPAAPEAAAAAVAAAPAAAAAAGRALWAADEAALERVGAAAGAAEEEEGGGGAPAGGADEGAPLLLTRRRPRGSASWRAYFGGEVFLWRDAADDNN